MTTDAEAGDACFVQPLQGAVRKTYHSFAGRVGLLVNREVALHHKLPEVVEAVRLVLLPLRWQQVCGLAEVEPLCRSNMLAAAVIGVAVSAPSLWQPRGRLVSHPHRVWGNRLRLHPLRRYQSVWAALSPSGFVWLALAWSVNVVELRMLTVGTRAPAVAAGASGRRAAGRGVPRVRLAAHVVSQASLGAARHNEVRRRAWRGGSGGPRASLPSAPEGCWHLERAVLDETDALLQQAGPLRRLIELLLEPSHKFLEVVRMSQSPVTLNFGIAHLLRVQLQRIFGPAQIVVKLGVLRSQALGLIVG
mmetsp:Transcript_47821/g.135061  ORF Transcript_47821/g.135061 Transcript_47821/m.135061 type:complete len:305 (+) Transcript_47821:995-1909(+)